MTTLRTRAELGLSFNGTSRPLSRVTTMVVHHTPGRDRNADPAEQWHIIDDYHRGGHPSITAGVGYHLGVSVTHDTVLEGRPLDQVGAHAAGHNAKTVGVAVLGPGDADVDGTLAMLRHVYHHILVPQLGNLEVIGHRDVGQTSCPSTALWSRLHEVIEPKEEDMAKLTEDAQAFWQEAYEQLQAEEASPSSLAWVLRYIRGLRKVFAEPKD